MLGSALKLAVQSTEVGKDSADFYFPAGTWCDVFNKTQGVDGCKTYATGEMVTLRTWAWDFYLHLRSGHIVPMQDATTMKANTTVDLQNKPVDFHIHASCDASICTASGDYINDDGLVLATKNKQNIYELNYQQSVGSGTLTLSVSQQSMASDYDK